MSPSHDGHRIAVGDVIAEPGLTGALGGSAAIPDPVLLTHLQFRRFAGCPICNLHLRSFVARHDALAAAGVREVVVFHSTEDELRTYESGLPFPLVADPHKRLYAKYGVEASRRAFGLGLVPHMPAIAGNFLRGLLTRRRRMAPPAPTGGSLGLPADVLIDSTGKALAVHYGSHAYDQWSVDEVLALALSAAPPSRPAAGTARD